VLDLALIRDETDTVRAALLKRMDEVDLDTILALDRESRALATRIETLRAKRNDLSRAIGRARGAGEDYAALQDEVVGANREAEELEPARAEAERRLTELLAQLPNMPAPNVPAGGKEANEVVRVWGEKPALPPHALDHVELSKRLGIVDYERGTKLGGSGLWLYSGIGAALEWSLLDWFNRTHRADGYEFFLPPHLLIDECGFAAGQFPKFYDDVFHVRTAEHERERFLLPTAETAILNVYRDEIVPDARLPIKAFAYTPCYRREAGSHRTDERGTIRGHQFNKVEMFQFTRPEDGPAALEELLAKAESLMQALGLHYRVSLLAAGDTSASMTTTYDVEVWIPSINQYKEVSSVSWAGDYQARRAKIRFKREGSKRTEFVHTLNGSGLATSRLVPALLEQHQREDGAFTVPLPLRPWLGVDVIEPKA
jgi:seryl-tRNA synthetase